MTTTTKSAMLWFFEYEASESLNNLKEKFSEQIEDQMSDEIVGDHYSFELNQKEIALDLFKEACEENADLLDWLTPDDSLRVADLFGLPLPK